MSLEAEARAHRWLRHRTIDDRADVLVVHRRAQALLELAAPRLVRISWRAWLAAEPDEHPLDPTPELEKLVETIEALARGVVVPDLYHWHGAPRHRLDPRLVVIEDLARVTGVDPDELDALTHAKGQAVDQMLTSAMRRWSTELDAERAAVRTVAAPTLEVVDEGHVDQSQDAMPVFASSPCSPGLMPIWSQHRAWPQILRGHFGREDPPPDEPADTAPLLDPVLVRKVLAGVARIDGRFTFPVVVDLLTGVERSCLRHHGLDRLRTFGTLRDENRTTVIEAFGACEASELVVAVGEPRRGHRAYRLTELGDAVMRGRESVRVDLPAVPAGAGDANRAL